MGDKSPKKPPTKKLGLTLKEKRAAKKTKRDEATAPLIGRDARRGG
ncbi:MAG TPA: hypothetical protein VFP54_07180 [Acidimicrobiales bacterium]|nr:hypothetical protein [Acidimicrobiales bacterium]